MTKDEKMQVAVFRFSVIGDFAVTHTADIDYNGHDNSGGVAADYFSGGQGELKEVKI